MKRKEKVKVERIKYDDKFSPLQITLEKSLEAACVALVLEHFMECTKQLKVLGIGDMLYLADAKKIVADLLERIHKIYADPAVEKFWETSTIVLGESDESRES